MANLRVLWVALASNQLPLLSFTSCSPIILLLMLWIPFLFISLSPSFIPPAASPLGLPYPLFVSPFGPQSPVIKSLLSYRYFFLSKNEAWLSVFHFSQNPPHDVNPAQTIIEISLSNQLCAFLAAVDRWQSPPHSWPLHGDLPLLVLLVSSVDCWPALHGLFKKQSISYVNVIS